MAITERSKEIIHFAREHPYLSYKEIGLRFGISRQRAQQICSRGRFYKRPYPGETYRLCGPIEARVRRLKALGRDELKVTVDNRQDACTVMNAFYKAARKAGLKVKAHTIREDNNFIVCIQNLCGGK